MAFTAGTISQVAVASTTDSLLTSAATGGTTPYTYQYYRSTTTNFSPGAATSISGATALALSDSGLTPGTVYYYKNVATDSAGTPSVVTTAQITVTTLAPTLSQNQFTESPFLGMLDLRYNTDTVAAQFDPAGTGTLIGGQAVKFTTAPAGGAPTVVPCTATSDTVAGFVNYDIKTAVYNPGDRLEMSMRGNVMYLYAATAINRGQEVTSLPAAVAGGCNGGVIPAVGSGGLPKVGFSLDTTAIGQLGRIFLSTPAYIVS